MRAVRIAITLPEEAIRRVREAVRTGRARSASAFIAQAIERQTVRDQLQELLGEMREETGGPETRAGDGEFGVRARPRRG